MIKNGRGVLLVKVDGNKLRNAMRKNKNGTPWSVKCANAGFGNSFLTNGLYKYARENKDDAMQYAYISAETYEGVCGLFGIDPRDYCDEWAEYKGTAQAKTAEQKQTTAVNADLLDVLKEISGNLADINASIVRLENVQTQICKKIQKPFKPAAVLPPVSIK